MNKAIQTTRENELWLCNLLGRICDEDGQNFFIFVAIDHHSKWMETCIINNKTGTAIAKAFEKLVIKKHGSPEKLLTDHEKEFENSELSNLLKKYNIIKLWNSPGHHETLGALKRGNQTLFRKLKKISNYKIENCKKNLEKATYSYNISFNRAIQNSPYVFKY